jgi:hypothetical protein
VAIPLKQLVIFNLVNLVEILAVTAICYKAMGMQKPWRILLHSFLIFLALAVSGVIIQSVLPGATS